MTEEAIEISKGDVTLSEYARLCKDFYWDQLVQDIRDLEDDEAESMVMIAINHVSIAYHLLDQARSKNFRYLVEQETRDREIRKANETLND